MHFQKYFSSFLFLFFMCHTPPAMAQTPPEQRQAQGQEGDTSLPEGDLDQRLRRWFHKSSFMQKLLDSVFINPKVPTITEKSITFLPYQGKVIASIHIDKYSSFKPGDTKWRRLGNTLFPITRDWVIKEHLKFVVSDPIDAQQLAASQQNLNRLPFIKEAQITLQETAENSEAVDVHITTQDSFPIGFSLEAAKAQLSINYNNVLGWGHVLQNHFSYEERLGYGATYRVPDIKQSGIAGELQYLDTYKKGTKQLRVFKKFDAQANYLGEAVISRTRKSKRRLLDNEAGPKPISFEFDYQDLWLGKAFKNGQDNNQGRFFLTGLVANQRSVHRPGVAKYINRFFHDYLFLAGSLGFAQQGYYEGQQVYDVSKVEQIPYTSKINLIGGYQLGEFIHRPYLRLDVAKGAAIQQLGYLQGTMNVGGFLYQKAVEQGIINFDLNYFTPLVPVGQHCFRQFVALSYLAGFNMFTGELISTNREKVDKSFKDPFIGGTQRLQLHLETVMFTPIRLAGCQMAALGFVEIVSLQDAQGRTHQDSFCKVFGMGCRIAPPRFALGTLQIKLGYHPIIKHIDWKISVVLPYKSKDLPIDKPGAIPFEEH